MQIAIDMELATPIYAQLVEQVKLAVQEGALKPGDPLPSIRQLAGDLDVNQKTVAKAYRLLERDRVLQAKGYRGSFVHPDAAEHSSVDLRTVAQTAIDGLLNSLREAGLTDSEIRAAFAARMNTKLNGGQ